MSVANLEPFVVDKNLGEILTTVPEARVLTAWWRQHYNHVRPHSALGYRPPAPAVVKLPIAAAS